ncbi:hypothetical protein KP509_12G060600 [Ceratopteris richardii]|uniref:Uncharacterized protein n=1 Tax=Ceratopteris richardii TaxID=49495 RepID=A0A8T2TJM9_CERRI|nr:hypothetical protein KP509_12G060600 [Ceratopteris richardii]
MELGSENTSCSISGQDDHARPSSDGVHSDVMDSARHGNGVLSAEGSTKNDELTFKDQLTDAEGPLNGETGSRIANVIEAPSGNADIQGARESEVDQGFDPTGNIGVCTIDLGEPPEESRNEMEPLKFVKKWKAIEKNPGDIQENGKDTGHLGANHSSFQRFTNPSGRRAFFLVRMPWGGNNDLKSKIKMAELQLEEASRNRDVIRAALQLKRASKIGLLDKLKIVRDKERALKDACQRKRLEIEPFQTALNRLKLADSKFREDEIFFEEDLDNKIASLHHRIQHESIPLKEEKQLIREIKQLESRRSEVCANDAEHAELLANYGPKEGIQDQLDILYRELDVLRENHNQIRIECMPIEKELEDLNVKIDELVGQLEEAKHSHAAALSTCKELKKKLNEQNAEFYKYKDDLRKAKELAVSKNLDDLAAFCNKQVEGVLQSWNGDPTFREKYIKNNLHSTLKRLETLDGRSLGLDEEPVLLMGDTEAVIETQPKDKDVSSKKVGLLKIETQPKDKDASSKKVGLLKEANANRSVSCAKENHAKESEGKKLQHHQEKNMKGNSVNLSHKKDDRELKRSVAKQIENPEYKSPVPSVTSSSSTVPTLIEDETVKAVKAAEMKEKRKQEEMAKAKEAAERKKRQAERAQAKAQLWAQKEAERREKEKAKRARRKAAESAEKEKIVETQAVEEKEHDAEKISVPAVSDRGSPSEGTRLSGKQLKSQKPIVSRSHSWKKFLQLPSVWLWISLIAIILGIVLIFVAKY